MKFSNTLFWDVPLTQIDWNNHARFVINRVLQKGTLNDWKELKAYYGIEKIKEEVVKMKFLDHKTLNFCSHYFGFHKSQFKCYNIEPSIRKLWNY